MPIGTPFEINSKDPLALTATDHALFQVGGVVGAAYKRFAGSQVINPTNVIVINSLSDLPTPADLGDGLGLAYRLISAVYEIGASFSHPYPFAPAAGVSSLFVAVRGNQNTLTFTGAGAAVRQNPTTRWGIIDFNNIVLKGDTTNTCFAYEGTGAEGINLANVGFEDFLSMGTIKALNALSTILVTIDNSGKLILSSNTINYLQGLAITKLAPIGDSLLRIEGNFLSTAVQNCQFIPVAGDSAFDIDSAIAGTIDIATSNVVTAFGGVAFKAGSITSTDPRILSHATRNITDSVTTAYIAFEDNAALTVIRNVNEWRVIVGTTIAGELERASMSGDGEITFSNLEAIKGNIDLLVSAEKSGSATNFEIGVFQSTGDTGAITAFADAGGGLVTVTSATHLLSNGEYINHTGTTSYNGDFIASNVTADTYDIEATWVADDATGTWFEMAIVPLSRMQRSVSSIPSSFSTKGSVSVVSGNVVDVRTRNITNDNDATFTFIKTSF